MADKTLATACLAGALALAVTGGVNAGDFNARLLADSCAGCHGTDGASSGPATPTIAGISKAYFIELMQKFASGEVPSTIMGRIARGYSAEEIDALGEQFSNRKFVRAAQESDAKLASLGADLHGKFCEKCHAEGGSSATDDAGILSGQWQPYLAWSLADFRDAKREAPKKMQKKLDELLADTGNKGIEALLNFYASGK